MLVLCRKSLASSNAEAIVALVFYKLFSATNLSFSLSVEIREMFSLAQYWSAKHQRIATFVFFM